MHLVTDMYGDSGARIMSDIDLLVPREDIESCMAALQELQYKPVDDINNDYHEGHHHCAPLFRPGAYGTLEVHHSVMECPFNEILPTKLAMSNAEPLAVQGHCMKW